MSQHINPIPLQTDVKALNDSFGTVVALTSTSHTVEGYWLKVGRMLFVSGKFVPKSVTTETINLNTPLMNDQIGIVGRDDVNGNLVTFWANDSFLSTYMHSGSITVGNPIKFSFACLARS